MCTINTSLSCTSQVWEMCCVLKWVCRIVLFSYYGASTSRTKEFQTTVSIYMGVFLIFTLLFHLNAYGIISVIDHDTAAHLIICKGGIPHIFLKQFCKRVVFGCNKLHCLCLPYSQTLEYSIKRWCLKTVATTVNWNCFFNQHLVFMATLLKATCQQHIRSSCSVYIGSNHLCDCCALKSIKVFVTLHKPNTQNRSRRI